jgi:hypothetical protein
MNDFMYSFEDVYWIWISPSELIHGFYILLFGQEFLVWPITVKEFFLKFLSWLSSKHII